MKIVDQLLKELKIASRGFYFCVEIFITFIVLFVLLFIVPEESISKKEEYLFYNMKPELSEKLIDSYIDAGTMKKIDDKTFALKPAVINVYPDRETIPNKYDGIVYPLVENETDINYEVLDDGGFSFEFVDEKEITGKGYAIYNENSGKLDKKVYLFDHFEDVLRLSKSERRVAGIIFYDEQGRENYEIFLPGKVTGRFKNITYAMHNDNIYEVMEEAEQKEVTYLGEINKLNNRESFVPLTIIYLNGLMGIFIVAAYIFNDKKEGVIKALEVTPLSMKEYLLSKILSVVPVSVITSLVIALPIMKLKPNYLLLIYLVVCISLFAGVVGVFIGSVFHDIKSSFALIMVIMIVFMLPVLSYYIPTFSPDWIKFIPSHYMMIAIKEAILSTGKIGYMLKVGAGILAVSIPVFVVSAYRFKKES